MSFRAYTDNTKTQLISIDKAIYHRDKNYFCENKECNAILHVRFVDGIKSSHFFALSKHPHSKNCCFGISHFKKDDYDEENFSFDNFINNICSSPKNNANYNKNDTNINKIKESKDLSKEKTLRTVREMFFMCKYEGINYKYAGIAVSNILVDDRTKHIYSKYIPNDFRIIQCSFKIYCENDFTIKVTYSDFLLTLNIQPSIYKEIKNLLVSNREYQFAIAGVWRFFNNSYSTSIASKKQIYIIRK